MTEADLIYLKKWFADYTRLFYSMNEEDRKNIILKVVHTHNVCGNIVRIAKASTLSDNQIKVAETVALFHDVGRFSQYAEYKTFRDADSVNHGLLGSKILAEKNVLRDLPENERQLIIEAVKFHNAFAIPNVPDDVLLFLKLIRDADKVDIYRVFIEYYESPAKDRASATAFGVPDSPGYSGVMLSCIMNRKVASYSDIRTENDFRLMKLSWLFDMHFRESIRLLHEKDYISKIADKLPRTEEILKALEVINRYVSERLQNV
ncbi:MAG: HD family phosphohydrolase [Nitrospiraceae bacterium]|nr:MAG: HD family phosphohydrolase [Nitrospiraceae bacterium]